MKKTILILLATVFMINVLNAQKPEVITNNKPGWHKIGDANVSFKTDKDEFVVFGKDKFKAIQVKVTDAPVRIEDMQVWYDGGAKEDVPLRSDFNAGGESRIIDLKEHSSGIKKVTFVYRTRPNMRVDKAHIELWGLK